MFACLPVYCVTACEMLKSKVSAFVFVINLFDLGGSENLVKNSYKVENLIDFPGH